MFAYRLTSQGAQALAPASLSLDELTSSLGGLYTTFRTWENGKRFLGLNLHLKRLYRGQGQPGLSPQEMETGLRRLIETLAPSGELRVRLVSALAPAQGCFALLEPFTPPEASLYLKGARVISVYLPRPRPQLKTTAFLKSAAALRAGFAPGIYEAIRLNRAGRALEGLSSNFYLVRDGIIFTAGRGVLAGVTRSIILRLARRLGLQVELTAPDLRQPFDEAFLSSSSRGAMPIVEVDGQVVGSGLPGPLTQRIMDNLLDY